MKGKNEERESEGMLRRKWEENERKKEKKGKEVQKKEKREKE